MVVTHWYHNIDNSHDPHTQEDIREQGGEARRMINLTNRLICYIAKHKLHKSFMEQCPYTGQTYQLCTRCTALLPMYNLD